MLKSLFLWLSFSGAFFFNDYKVPERALLEEYGQGSKTLLRTKENYVLTSWNVYKGAIEGLPQDLAQLINESDFVNIQEFLLSPTQEQQIKDFSSFRWMFAKSFQDHNVWTGVAMVSRWRPYQVTPLRSLDAQPLSQTPKMSMLAKYKMENGQELWIANTHALNFSLGLGPFKRQINGVIDELKKHTGPLIFTGDFNTWMPPRYNYLIAQTEALGLKRAELVSPIGFIGATLDHIFYRDIQMNQVSVLVDYSTSDHLPLRIEFTLP